MTDTMLSNTSLNFQQMKRLKPEGATVPSKAGIAKEGVLGQSATYAYLSSGPLDKE